MGVRREKQRRRPSVVEDQANAPRLSRPRRWPERPAPPCSASPGDRARNRAGVLPNQIGDPGSEARIVILRLDAEPLQHAVAKNARRLIGEIADQHMIARPGRGHQGERDRGEARGRQHGEVGAGDFAPSLLERADRRRALGRVCVRLAQALEIGDGRKQNGRSAIDRRIDEAMLVERFSPGVHKPRAATLFRLVSFINRSSSPLGPTGAPRAALPILKPPPRRSRVRHDGPLYSHWFRGAADLRRVDAPRVRAIRREGVDFAATRKRGSIVCGVAAPSPGSLRAAPRTGLGAASTSTSAARWRRRCSTIPVKSTSRRWRQGAPRRPAIGRRRSASARRALDRGARRRPAVALYDDHFLRWPGFSGEAKSATANSARTRRCDGLPATGKLARTRSGRFFSRARRGLQRRGRSPRSTRP